jgi:hypothetical protein
MNKRPFSVIQGAKSEQKSPLAGQHPNHPMRTYQEAVASQRLMKKLRNIGSVEDAARYYWDERERG